MVWPGFLHVTLPMIDVTKRLNQLASTKQQYGPAKYCGLVGQARHRAVVKAECSWKATRATRMTLQIGQATVS